MKNFIVSFVLLFSVSSAVMAQANVPEDKKLRDLIFQDIKKQGVDKDPAVKAAAQAAQDVVMIRAWGQKVLSATPVTPALKESIYKELTNTLGDQEYKLVHFFVAEEKAAQALIQKMKESSDWSSLDPKSVLGADAKFSMNRTEWINLSAVMPEFRATLRTLKKGEYTTTPIRVKDGFHVVGLTDVRPFKLPPAETLDKDLTALAERKILDQYIQSLTASTGKK